MEESRCRLHHCILDGCDACTRAAQRAMAEALKLHSATLIRALAAEADAKRLSALLERIEERFAAKCAPGMAAFSEPLAIIREECRRKAAPFTLSGPDED